MQAMLRQINYLTLPRGPLLSHRYNSLKGKATEEGTRRYVEYATSMGKPVQHFKSFDRLFLSSLGMGTYLGDETKEDDLAVENSVYDSVKSGSINVIDTALNYRGMKSEKSIGRALTRLIDDGIITREQVFVSTKNGYITNDADYPLVDAMEYIQRMYISTDLITPDDISSGYHIMNPNYISRSIDKSLLNMRMDTIDLVYIHNAFESWHEDVDRNQFHEMLSSVFEAYEKYRAAGKIQYYGMASWTCFRTPSESKEYLSLEEVVQLAVRVAGRRHGFRFIQLPYNLAYSEALLLRNQTVGDERSLTVLEAASRLNVGVFTSIPLFQGRLLKAQIPDYAGLTENDRVAKLLQIIRSTPWVIAPLIGQKKPEHVRENLRVSNLKPLDDSQFKEAKEILLKGK